MESSNVVKARYTGGMRALRIRTGWGLVFCAFLAGCGGDSQVDQPTSPLLDPNSGVDAKVAAITVPRDQGQSDFEAGYGDRAAEHALLTLEELLESTGTPGLSVAVFADGEVTWARGFGVSDRESGQPVTPDTLFQAASISKPVATLAVLEAYERGLLTLDQPIAELTQRYVLPADDPAWSSLVTPRRLVSHTAGTTVHGFPGYSPLESVPDAVAVLQGFGNTDPVRVDLEPGTESRYSGGGSTLMQIALEDVTGRDFAELVKDWVLDPAGATSSGYFVSLPAVFHGTAARAHLIPEGSPDGTRPQRSADPWHAYPELFAAGLWTTPSDLCRIAIDVQRSIQGTGGKVLDQETAQMMLTPVGIGSFGLGFNLAERGTDEDEVWYFSHTGGNWGFRSYLMASRDGDYGAAVILNGTDFNVILEVMKRIAFTHGWEGDLLSSPRNWE